MARSPNIRSWEPYSGWQGWARGFVITTVAAAFLAYAGAFGSSRGAPAQRFVYWLSLMVIGWLWGAAVSRIVLVNATWPRSLWGRIAVATAVIAAPYSILVGLVTHQMFHSNFKSLADLADLVLSVVAVTLAMIVLNTLVERQAAALTHAGPEGAPPPKFLDRLPAKLRGAELWAVEAEDHYLRLHTSLGQDLILLRLSDAVAELEGIEGAQVHRSWWVAREAIAEAVRGDGRATLTLKDGVEVPVSRTYARLLRQQRWI